MKGIHDFTSMQLRIAPFVMRPAQETPKRNVRVFVGFKDKVNAVLVHEFFEACAHDRAIFRAVVTILGFCECGVSYSTRGHSWVNPLSPENTTRPRSHTVLEQ